MSSTAETPRSTLATAIVLFALLPAAAAAQEPQSSPDLDAPADAVATAQPRASAVEASGLLVWAWRAVSSARPVREPLQVSRFAPEPAAEVASMEPAALFEFGTELAADRGRLHHGGNLLRIDF